MQIKPHRCMQNFWVTSKAMEADAIVRLVRNFPKTRNAYVRVLVMDDDATTPAHPKEDTAQTQESIQGKHREEGRHLPGIHPNTKGRRLQAKEEKAKKE